MKITVKQLRKMIAEAIEAHPGVVAKFKHPLKPPTKLQGAEPTVEPGELPPGTRIPLVFSDVDFGTEEFGFIPHPRKRRSASSEEDSESQDAAYAAHLKKLGVAAKVDPKGYVVLL